MRIILYFFTLILFYLIPNFSCTKPEADQPSPVDTLSNSTDTSTYTVDNEWQCTIDGHSYSGTVDTSFLQMAYAYQVDSVIVCTGTSADKKTKIHFKLSLDRTNFPGIGIKNDFNTFLVFDTVANNLFLGSVSSATERIYYKLDTMFNNNLVVSYSGNLTDQKFVNHTINGKFSCKLNSGNNEPNKFYCLLGFNSAKRFGYFKSVMLNANTLIMEGIDYMDYPLNEFRIAVRTGGTINPGVYKSANGDINFVSVPPSWMDHNYYVDDTRGNMTVIIESVNGNIVKGSFYGVTSTLDTIQSGAFSCRVNNYTPEADGPNRWAFSTLNWAWNDVYNCFAGNITNAVKAKIEDRYYLTINGESDNGASAFKLVVSSPQQITKGLFQMDNYPTELFDTIYFKSGVPTWNGNLIHLYADQSTVSFVKPYCYIDTIDNYHVVGTFYGDVAGFDDGKRIHGATFNANF